MAKVEPVNTKTVCWFKYNPKEQRLDIMCQPIKPYSKIDELKVDTFTREPKPNPGFKGGKKPNE